MNASARGWSGGPLAGLVLALIGGTVAWGLVHFAPVFTVPAEFHIPNLGAAPERFEALEAVQAGVARRNAMVDLGLFGAVLGVMVALGQAIERGSFKPPLAALPIGAAGGCAAAWIGSIVHTTLDAGALADLADTVMIHAVTCGVLGLCLGAAVAMFSTGKAVLAASVVGMAGGAMAGALYSISMSVLLPVERADQLVPGGVISRMLWIGVFAGSLGLLIPWTLGQRNNRREP